METLQLIIQRICILLMGENSEVFSTGLAGFYVDKDKEIQVM